MGIVRKLGLTFDNELVIKLIHHVYAVIFGVLARRVASICHVSAFLVLQMIIKFFKQARTST